MTKYKTKKAIVYSLQGIQSICDRKLKTIISTNNSMKFIGQEILICDNEKAYGIIVLNNPLILDDSLFKNHFKRHNITEEFREACWPGINKFFSFTFRIKKIFKEPLEYLHEAESTMGYFIEDVKFVKEEELLKTITKYSDKLEEFKNTECNEEDVIVKNLLMEVYKLYIKKLELTK